MLPRRILKGTISSLAAAKNINFKMQYQNHKYTCSGADPGHATCSLRNLPLEMSVSLILFVVKK